jgi:predicted PurR-regulated permease PerM
MQKAGLQKSLEIILLIVIIIGGLYFAKPFLVPVCFGGLFAMLFLPVSRKFESYGLNRGLSSLLCTLILLFVIAGLIFLISWQVSDLVKDLGNIEQKIQTLWKQVKEYISDTLGISEKQQQEILEQQSKNSGGFFAIISAEFLKVIVDLILVFVYIFLFMFYRGHIKKFIIQVTPKNADAKTEDAIQSIEKVSQQYITGLSLMIICLWIMYSIGFSIVGLKNAVFFAILCGVLEVVPFIGNLTGNAIAILMAITQGGGNTMLVGILITYGIVQFLQSYILEPLIVGTEVNINPLFTIIGLVLGELIWGIPGLILAIPLLGILKIIFDHIPSLKPFGFIIGREKKKRGIADKVKSWFKKSK